MYFVISGVSPDGKFQFDYDHDVFDLIVKSFKRTWIKSIGRWGINLKNGISEWKIVQSQLYGSRSESGDRVSPRSNDRIKEVIE